MRHKCHMSETLGREVSLVEATLDWNKTQYERQKKKANLDKSGSQL